MTSLFDGLTLSSRTPYPANGFLAVGVPIATATPQTETITDSRGNVYPVRETIIYSVYLSADSGFPYYPQSSLPGAKQIDPLVQVSGKILDRLQPVLGGDPLTLDIRAQSNDQCPCKWGDREGVLILKRVEPSAWYDEGSILGYPFQGVFTQPKRNLGFT